MGQRIAVTSIIRAQQLMLARIDAALKPFSLSFARYEMLRLLGFTREGRMPMASAIARLQVHPTSVTNTVDRLVRDDLLRFLKRDSDERGATILCACHLQSHLRLHLHHAGYREAVII